MPTDARRALPRGAWKGRKRGGRKLQSQYKTMLAEANKSPRDDVYLITARTAS